MPRFRSEAEASEVVIGHLRDLKHDVYCEVSTGMGRIDIVAVSGSIITSVEVKNRCNMEVLEQASNRSPFVHRSVAAFPIPVSGQPDLCFRAMHSMFGIGIWQIMPDRIVELFHPRLNRKPIKRYIVSCLCDEQRNQKAGVNAGFWSPFKDTRKRLVDHVAKNQPCSLKSAISSIKHHYSSHSTAYSSIGQWIRTGVIDEIEMTKEGLVLVDGNSGSENK